MGQSLFGIACPEDHDELRKNLQFKDETFETKTDGKLFVYKIIPLRVFLVSNSNNIFNDCKIN